MLLHGQSVMLLGGLLASLAAAYLVPRGFVPPASWCLPTSNLTELSGCIAMSNYTDKCQALSTDREKKDCFCQQEMLSDFFKCQSDVTLCIGSQQLDSSFSSLVGDWHAQCTALTFTPTTPPVSTLTATWSDAVCYSLALSCSSADYETSQCASTYLPAHTTQYLSCFCKEPVYSLFSECQYNGNISCSSTKAAESNIVGYSICPYFRPGASTLPPVNLTSLIVTPSQVLSPSSILPSGSSTIPASTTMSGSTTVLGSTTSPTVPIVTKPTLPPTASGATGTTSSSGALRLKIQFHNICLAGVPLFIVVIGFGMLQLI